MDLADLSTPVRPRPAPPPRKLDRQNHSRGDRCQSGTPTQPGAWMEPREGLDLGGALRLLAGQPPRQPERRRTRSARGNVLEDRMPFRLRRLAGGGGPQAIRLRTVRT